MMTAVGDRDILPDKYDINDFVVGLLQMLNIRVVSSLSTI